MKIFISGGTGFIGSYLVEKLKISQQLTLVTRNDRLPDNEIYSDIEFVTYSQLKNNPDLFSGIDILIHMAAVRPTKVETDETFEKYNQNLLVANELFRIAAAHGVKKIIHLSSKSVYGKSNPMPYDESQTPLSDSFYGLSKKMTEDMLFLYSRKYNFQVVNLRLAQVIGWGEQNKNIVTVCLDNALKKRNQTVYGKGCGARSYVYVKDVVDVMDHFVMNEVKGTFNLAWSQPISNAEIALTINEVFENPDIEFKETLKEDTAVESMNTEKIKEMINWSPNFPSLRDALIDMKKYYEKNSH